MAYSKEKEVVLQAVQIASQLTLEVRHELVEFNPVHKLDNSPVTIADFGAQAIICKIIHDRFPEDEILGEEDSSKLREDSKLLKQVAQFVNRFQSATVQDICDWIDHGRGRGGSIRYWTIDPVDGTRGFIRKDQYVVALALIEDGQVKLGILGCPVLDNGLIVVGERGAGINAFSLDLEPLLFETRSTAQRLVESFEGTSNSILHNLVAEKIGLTSPSLKLDSQVKYVRLARGDGSVYLRLPPANNPVFKENVWDHAAGSLILEEEGGKVTDQNGKPLDFTAGRLLSNNTGIVATLGIDHSKVIQAIKEFS